MKKILIIAAIIVVLAGAAYILYRSQSGDAIEVTQNPPTANFKKTGNLTKTEGDSSWYFVYEEPGKPALRVKLKIPVNLASNLEIGQRVAVEGNRFGNTVNVLKLSTQ